MTGSDEDTRFLAACEACGSVYAALERADGDIAPIGKPDGCTCGGTTFSRVDASESDFGSIGDPDDPGDDLSEGTGRG